MIDQPDDDKEDAKGVESAGEGEAGTDGNPVRRVAGFPLFHAYDWKPNFMGLFYSKRLY